MSYSAWTAAAKEVQLSPVVELEQLLQRQDDCLRRAKEQYLKSLRPAPSLVESLAGFRRSTPPTPQAAATSTTSSSSVGTSAKTTLNHPKFSVGGDHLDFHPKPPDSPAAKSKNVAATPLSPSAKVVVEKEIQFISISEQGSFIEDLRRIAELVVIGENYVTSLEKKKARSCIPNSTHGSADLSIDEPPKEKDEEEEKDTRSPDLADVFDLFFERNTLANWVQLLTGHGFDLPGSTEREDEAHPHHSQESTGVVPSNNGELEQPLTMLLPPMAVATQVVQSISILVQNVSRATSLYILFSNDHINDLINLNLELYEHAERNRRRKQRKPSAADTNGGGARIFASPEVAELTTHFVTFLKSLALRMNAETLQFFLQYPSSSTAPPSAHNNNGDPIPSAAATSMNPMDGCDASDLVAKFPLYDRALDFCAAHQDSFIRVTAMNICLNTIRLTTVVGPPRPTVPDNSNTEHELEGAFGSSVVSPTGPSTISASTPDAVLHNAQALPFRERLAIAHYTCTPTRVELLIAPIFTKLSERWSALEEAIRAMTAFEQSNAQEVFSGTRNTEKVARVREKVKRDKLVNGFRYKAADLQDELLLLEDVFKVGLTVLNEQMIEMMMATFVYPLLLQPLILFSQRFMATVHDGGPSRSPSRRPSKFDHPFGATLSADHREAQSQLLAVTAPAQAALFTMAAAFRFLTNPPLLRLMFTALLHPISPDSTTVPTVRSTLQVATIDIHGQGIIRVDPEIEGEIAPNNRESYAFGAKDSAASKSSSSFSNRILQGSSHDVESCVFVLAPALAEVLQFRGQDYGLLARTKSNSYRKALFQCMEIELPEFAQMRLLAVCTVDAAISRLDPKLAADLLFGASFAATTTTDDIPLDERNLDSAYAHKENDRGIGASVALESRHSIASRPGEGTTNLVGQVVFPLVTAVLTAKRSCWKKEWILSFDGLATHALLLLGKGYTDGLVAAAKSLEIRRDQAAHFLVHLSNRMGRNGNASRFLAGIPHASTPDSARHLRGGVMNALIHGVEPAEPEALMEKFLRLQKRTTTSEREEGLFVTVSSSGNFDDMINRISSLFLVDTADVVDNQPSTVKRDINEARDSIAAFFQVDALLSFFKYLSDSKGLALQDVDVIAGLALSSEDGTLVRTVEHTYSRNVCAPISPPLASVLLVDGVGGSGVDDGDDAIVSGGTLKLAGYPAIPCVCEAPASLAHLFVHPGVGVLAQGVTWQSLYLVFKDGWMIFAQPIPGGPSDVGRIIGACWLECTFVEPDTTTDNYQQGGSPARRLRFAYASSNPHPPPLFLLDEHPDTTKAGGGGGPQRRPPPILSRVPSHVSDLDVWCENQKVANYAYQIASSQIFTAKAQRGQRLLSFLCPG